MAQVEVSRTIVFTQPRYARAFFDALVTDNLYLGRPDTVEIIFDRQVRSSTEGEFGTNVITRGTEVTINAFYKHSRIKQYLKKRPRPPSGDRRERTRRPGLPAAPA